MPPFDSRTNHPTRCAGFTLIELIFVMVILAILVGVSLPRFSRSYAHWQLERTAFDIAQQLRYAQAAAIANRKPVQCDVVEGVVACEHAVDPAAEPKPEAPQLPPRFAKGKAPPEGIAVAAQHPDGVEALRFYPDGHSDGGTIVVETEADAPGYRIQVDPGTGDVSVRTGSAAS